MSDREKLDGTGGISHAEVIASVRELMHQVNGLISVASLNIELYMIKSMVDSSQSEYLTRARDYLLRTNTVYHKFLKELPQSSAER